MRLVGSGLLAVIGANAPDVTAMAGRPSSRLGNHWYRIGTPNQKTAIESLNHQV
jgi:hypothetical protein